jgi:hypothetical protein
VNCCYSSMGPGISAVCHHQHVAADRSTAAAPGSVCSCDRLVCYTLTILGRLQIAACVCWLCRGLSPGVRRGEVQAGALRGAQEAWLGPLQHCVAGAGHHHAHICSAQGTWLWLGVAAGSSWWTGRAAVALVPCVAFVPCRCATYGNCVEQQTQLARDNRISEEFDLM